MKRLAEEKPDLILMDVVMPGQNGFQLTRAISRTPEYDLVSPPWTDSKDVDPVWIGDTVYFISDRDGVANVWAFERGPRRLRPRQMPPRCRCLSRPFFCPKFSGPSRSAS